MGDEVLFKSALKTFCDLIALENETMLALAHTYEEIRRKISSPEIPGVEILSEEYNNRKQELHRKYLAPHGRNVGNPSILKYIQDAVKLYERRLDEFQGQTALLFHPDCDHIYSIRSVISLLTETEFSPSSTDPVFKFARDISTALDDVQINAYQAPSARRDNAILLVDGLWTHSTNGNIDSGTNGIVVRSYGSGKEERTILEMGPESVLPNMFEHNLFLNTSTDLTDIAVIMDNGDVVKFNHKSPGKLSASHILVPPSIEAHDEITRTCRKWNNAGGSATKQLTAEQLTFFCEKALPYICNLRPPEVKLPQRMR